VDIRVTDRSGSPLPGAIVKLEGGPSSRDGAANAQGMFTFTNVRAGTYRLRIERDRFTTFEKEIVVRTTRVAADAALSPAQPPPPPPEPVVVSSPAPAPPKLMPGEIAIVSVLALAEKILDGRDPPAETLIGCSGAMHVRLFVLRQPLAGHTHDEADETLYVIAGEGTINVGDQRQNIAAGSLSVVPRTISHTVTPRGRPALIMVSTISGPPCPKR